jgi:Rha family phage regulatory protein
MHPVPVLNFREFIEADGEELTTTSQQVAAVFGKRHDHVLRAIRALRDELPESHRPNIGAVEYLDAKGEQRGSYRITRDGFTILAMGFTGKKAPDLQGRRGGSAPNADPYGKAAARHHRR